MCATLSSTPVTVPCGPLAVVQPEMMLPAAAVEGSRNWWQSSLAGMVNGLVTDPNLEPAPESGGASVARADDVGAPVVAAVEDDVVVGAVDATVVIVDLAVAWEVVPPPWCDDWLHPPANNRTGRTALMAATVRLGFRRRH